MGWRLGIDPDAGQREQGTTATNHGSIFEDGVEGAPARRADPTAARGEGMLAP